MGTEEQRNSGYRGPGGTKDQGVQRTRGYRGPGGTEDQRNSETRGIVGTEDQWVQRSRGTEDQWVLRTRGTVGTEELFDKFLDKHPQKARLCQEHHIDPEDDDIDLA